MCNSSNRKDEELPVLLLNIKPHPNSKLKSWQTVCATVEYKANIFLLNLPFDIWNYVKMSQTVTARKMSFTELEVILSPSEIKFPNSSASQILYLIFYFIFVRKRGKKKILPDQPTPFLVEPYQDYYEQTDHYWTASRWLRRIRAKICLFSIERWLVFPLWHLLSSAQHSFRSVTSSLSKNLIKSHKRLNFRLKTPKVRSSCVFLVHSPIKKD